MTQIIIETYFWYFIVFSMVGYVCEVIYCSIPAKRFINRGFLQGPYLPVYGFGGLAVHLLLLPIAHAPLLVFLLGMLITSVIEYSAGFLLEILFHTRLWDYSGHRFHIRGRVCLKNSLLFGLLAMASLYLLHPMIERLLGNLSPLLRTLGAFGMLVLMAIDTTASAFRLITFTERLGQLRRLKVLVESPLQRISQNHDTVKERLEMEMARLREQLHRTGRRLFDAFPSMRSPELDRQFRLVKEMIEERRAKRKKRP